MGPAWHLEVPLRVSARIKLHHTSLVPLNANPVHWFQTWKQNQQYHSLLSQKWIPPYRIYILKRKAIWNFEKGQKPQILTHRHSGSSLMPLHYNTWGPIILKRCLGDDTQGYSGPCLLGTQHPRSSEQLHIIRRLQRQRKNRNEILMTDLKQVKIVTNLNWFVKSSFRKHSPFLFASAIGVCMS